MFSSFIFKNSIDWIVILFILVYKLYLANIKHWTLDIDVLVMCAKACMNGMLNSNSNPYHYGIPGFKN